MIQSDRLALICADALRELTVAGPADRAEVEGSLVRWLRASGVAQPRIVLWARSPAEARPLFAALQAAVRAAGDDSERLSAMAAWEAATRVGRGVPPDVVTRIARFAAGAAPDVLGSIRDAYGERAERARQRIAAELGDDLYTELVEGGWQRVGVARAHAVVFVGDALGWYEARERGQVTLSPFPLRWFSPELIRACAEQGVAEASDWVHWAAFVRGVFTAWVFRHGAILCERPSLVALDEQGRPHSESGPALAWSDGFELYAWHGTRVPRSLIERPWPARAILRTRNAEVRRCAIERIGWDTFVAESGCRQVGPRVADPANPGHELALYDIPYGYLDAQVRVLVCTNASPERDGIRRRFGLTVPPLISDPLAAAAWTFGLTPHEYRGLAAAS